MIALRVVAFADLDDTLFQTRRKLRGDEGALSPATVDSAGEPHSFQTPPQRALLFILRQAGVTLVPVTGRDQEAMRRVTLAWSSWQVLDHGATILEPNGTVHQPWAEIVEPRLRVLEASLLAARDGTASLLHETGCHLRLYRAHGAPLMLVAKHAQGDLKALAAVQAHWSGLTRNTALHVIANANNVTLMPLFPGKAGAVRYLRQHAFDGAELTLGLGDSVSDLDFMSACDFALTPAHGQLLRAVLAAELHQS